jgi:MFS family permease
VTIAPVDARLLRNGALVRALLSFGAAYTAEWSFTVALTLVAYADGGAFAAGLVGMLRLVPAAVLAPVISTYADRMARERVLMASSVVRGLATLAAAPVLWWGGPMAVVYALAVVSTIAFTPFRASHSALMPSLCRTPDELTSVNVARGALDSLSVVVGPLVAAVLVSVAAVPSVFVFAGCCALLAALLVVRLHYERLPIEVRAQRRLVVEIKEGLEATRSYDGVMVVVGFVALQAAIRGAFSVFVVVLAIDLLNGNDAAVGVLQGAVGVGAIAGSAVCSLLIGSRRMTRWLAIGVALWGAPLALMGLVPHYVVALAAACVIGVGNAVVDVTAFTLLARMVPDALMARVFGVLESFGAFAVGIGSLAVPVLIALIGPRGALIAFGVVAPAVGALWWRRLTAIDATVAVRSDAITLLRTVPMLRPLPVPAIERLAQSVRHEEVAAGATVFEAGDEGDRFYVIASGTVDVLDASTVVRTMGPGEGFGEIALMGGTTRTMTVQAAGPVELYAISAGEFLSAITSIGESRSAADAARSAYLSYAPGAAGDDRDEMA